MLMNQELRDWQARQEEANRQWQAEQREKERRWQEEQRARDQQQQKLDKRWDRVFEIGVLLLGILVGGLFTQYLTWLGGKDNEPQKAPIGAKQPGVEEQ